MSLEIDSVLAQIRSLSSQARVGTPQATAPQKSGPSEFATLLSKGIDSVNQTEQSAAKLSEAFQRALTEVRNRVVSAYQDIMNMQV
jgi:flagellar hook-basal body complex protein FliE